MLNITLSDNRPVKTDLKVETSKIVLELHRNQHKTNIF